MDSFLTTNSIFDGEIPIHVERNEMDAKDYIDETFNMINERKKLEKSKNSLNEETKRFITNLIQDHVGTKTKRENYYEHELINSYKERIYSLENQVKHMSDIILNFTKSSKCKHCNSDTGSQSQNLQGKSSFVPKCIDLSTPNQSITEENPEIENNIKTKTSINMQLLEVRRVNHSDYLKQLPKDTSNKKRVSFDDINQNEQRSKQKSCLVLSDSMFNGIHEQHFVKKGCDVKIKYFSGAKVDDLKIHLPDVLKDNKPDIIAIHAGTNNAPLMTSNAIVDDLLALKTEILKIHTGCQVVISTPITRTDNGKATLTIRTVNAHLNQLKIVKMDNSNITAQDLGKKGLHLSQKGKSKLSNNLINLIEKLSNDN